MKNYFIIGLIISLTVVLMGCSVNVGISSIDKATSAVMKADGEISLIQDLIESHRTKPVNIKTIEKKLQGVEQTLNDTEDYIVDETFAERHSRLIDRYESAKKDFDVLKKAEEEKKEQEEKEKKEKEQKEKEQKEKEQKEKEKPEDSNG